jgi:hypothetical protein
MQAASVVIGKVALNDMRASPLLLEQPSQGRGEQKAAGDAHREEMSSFGEGDDMN